MLETSNGAQTAGHEDVIERMGDLHDVAAPPVSVEEARGLALEHYGLDVNVLPLVGERDRNFHLRAAGGGDEGSKFSSASRWRRRIRPESHSPRGRPRRQRLSRSHAPSCRGRGPATADAARRPFQGQFSSGAMAKAGTASSLGSLPDISRWNAAISGGKKRHTKAESRHVSGAARPGFTGLPA